MKSIAWVTRIVWFVMSLLLCSMWFSFASGETIITNSTPPVSKARDADIVVPTISEEVTIAVASEAPIKTSFGGNGTANLNTQSQADTQLTLIAEPAYMCGQWFVGRVISSNINNTSVLIRLSDLNGRTVINLHPHVDSDGDYRQWVNYHNESSMFYVASWYYQVLIIAYNGSSAESIVFDTYIGTDCPSDNQEDGDDNTDPQQPWDHNLWWYHSNDSTSGTENNTTNNKPKANTSYQSASKQANTNNAGSSENTTTIEASITNDNLDNDTSTSGDADNKTLDSWLIDHIKNKNKDDRYKWLIWAILWGGLIYYGVKMGKK